MPHGQSFEDLKDARLAPPLSRCFEISKSPLWKSAVTTVLIPRMRNTNGESNTCARFGLPRIPSFSFKA